MKAKIRYGAAVAILCAFALVMAMFAGIFAVQAAEGEGDASVIAAETPFGEITAANGQEWGDATIETRNIAPLASSGKSIEYMNKAVGWWGPLARTLATPIDAVTTLGVSYDSEAKTSDMGVAFWLYIADETTKEAAKAAFLRVRIGPDEGNHWIEETTITGLEIGWNEVVVKHNAAWFGNGTPSSVSAIAYAQITIENLGENPKNMAINNIRLVKTTQTVSGVINRFEGISYDAEDAVSIMPATEEGLAAYWPTGATLSDNVPDGFTGKSVKLAAQATGNEKVFTTPVNALEAGKTWLDQTEISNWQSAASISFWLYIPDAASFKDAMANAAANEYAAVVFSSEGSATTSVNIDLKANYKYLNTGWNRIIIRLFNGSLNVGNINYFNIYNNMDVAQELEIYGVCVAKCNIMQQGGVINDNVSGDPFPDSSHVIVVSDTTATDGWENVSEVEAVEAGDLTSAVVANVPANSVSFTKGDIDLTDWTPEFMTATFWVYTNNPSKLRDSFNYFYAAESKAAYEAGNYYEVSLAGMTFVKGWNQVRIKFADDFVVGTVDATKLNYFCFVFPSAEDSKIAISDIRLFESNVASGASLINKIMEVNTAEPDPSHSVVLNATDNILQWDQYGFGIMPYGPEEGMTSLYLRSESGVLQTRLVGGSPVDISEFNFSHTVLTFWFYINDVDLMSDKDAQIELGAGNLEDDSNEFGWDFKLSSVEGLESGKWHKLALKIVPQGLEGSNETGMVNLSAIKFFRMYWLDTENEGPSAQVLISTLTIEEMDTSEFGDSKLVVLEKKDFTQGTTPGAIDEYDMIESADGTFPKPRPGEDEGDGDEEQPTETGCGGAVSVSTGIVTAVVLLGVSAVFIVRRKNESNRQ